MGLWSREHYTGYLRILKVTKSVIELVFIFDSWYDMPPAYLHSLSTSLVFTDVLEYSFTFTHCDFHVNMQ